jgi:lysophospholipase L1-like esterase
VAFAVVGLLTSSPGLALVAAALATALTQVATLSPRGGAVVGKAAHAVSRAVGHVLGVVLLGTVFALVFLPASLLVARRPLRPPGTVHREGSRWADRLAGESSAAAPRRSFQADGPVRRRAPLRFVLVLLAALLLVDLGLGLAARAAGLDGGPTAELTAIRQRIGAMEDAPAFADVPWREEYFDDLLDKSTDPSSLDFVAFGLLRNGGYESRYVNTEDGRRRSYTQADPPEGDVLRIAFFGGSTMFGEGQRDDHTIPSEVARLAEEEGLAVEVLNYGTQGYVSWQDALLFESVLATEDIDLAVFYDGINDVGIQYDHFSEDPSYYNWPAVEAQLEEGSEEATEGVPLGQRLRDLGSAYTGASLSGLLAERLRGDDLAAPAPDGDASEAERAEATVDLYQRSTSVIRSLGEREGVPVVFFWQPQQSPYPEGLVDALPDDVVDLSEALDDHEEVFLDGVHTDERGARIVAEQIWGELELPSP